MSRKAWECTRKIQYTKDAAEVRCSLEQASGALWVVPYLGRFVDHWHVGNRNRPGRPARR